MRLDPATNTATIEGKGTDRRGGSRGQVKVEYRLAPADGGTLVVVDADVTLSGAAAQFGRASLINEMSARLIQEFVSCLEAKLGAASVEEAAQIQAGEVRGFSLVWSSLMSAVVSFFKRLFGRARGE